MRYVRCTQKAFKEDMVVNVIKSPPLIELWPDG